MIYRAPSHGLSLPPACLQEYETKVYPVEIPIRLPAITQLTHCQREYVYRYSIIIYGVPEVIHQVTEAS